MLALLHRVLGATKRQLRSERDFFKRERDQLSTENARLTQSAYDGDALLCQEIDKLNDENDQINHDRTTLKFENERLKKERDLERTVLAERDKQARASALRIERLQAEARRFYKADGSYVEHPDTVNVVALRIEAAREIERLRVEADAREEYVKHLADEKERLRLRVVNLSEELQAVVATASETIGELKVELSKVEAEESGLNGYIDAVDNQISEALEKVGKFPGKPAGAPDRVDAICEAVVIFKEERNVARGAADQWEREADQLRRRLAEGEKLMQEGIGHVETLLAENAELQAAHDRLHRMVVEPEFLKAEARKQGERMVADVTCKHWAAKIMVMSFHDSLGSAENAVELNIGDDEFGHFLVTVQRRFGKSPIQLLDEAKDRIKTLEIALEASAELEQEWNAERRRLKQKARNLRSKLDHESFISRQLNSDIRKENGVLKTENEHVKDVCVELRRSRDDLYVTLSDLIRIDRRIADMKAESDSHPLLFHATRDMRAALGQANYYLDLYAPKEAAAV